jgi:hypothetical protein
VVYGFERRTFWLYAFAERRNSSLDGALLFTGREILAVGAMIGTHAKAQQDIGARSTAARSALYWGGFPVKISADGEILIHFMSLASTGAKSEATLEFT